MTWKRSPFVSSAPDRVLLGSGPIRVFLRCPDESIELNRVIRTPPGINAVITSAREVRVSLADNAPGIVDGILEIETTAPQRPPLRIPIVRFAPKILGDRSVGVE